MNDMLNVLRLIALMSLGIMNAQESGKIIPLSLSGSYESERLKRIEVAVGLESYDFSFTIPKDSMLESRFITYYKGVESNQSTYMYMVTPDDESSGCTGSIALFSRVTPDERTDFWRQWQFWIKKTNGRNNGVAVGLPHADFHSLSDKVSPKRDPLIRFTSAVIDVGGSDALIWKWSSPTVDDGETWRYELRVRLLPYDQGYKLNSVVEAGGEQAANR